ncbi:MAG TPA: hypothetical protein VIR54_14420 [Vicinamibacterales bacterium]
MFQYTKATLKDNLKLWVEGNGDDADDNFIDSLDEIIQRAELRLSRDLDLDNLDSVFDTTTAASASEVFKPDNLITERLLEISIAGVTHAMHKRHRAWTGAVNRAGTELDTANPLFKVYYSELDETRWTVAPIPDDAYLITVHGVFRPASIVDGNDDTTTWFSTRVPDLLQLASAIEAAAMLKNWARKAAAEAEYTAKLDDVRGITENLQRADIESIVMGRQVARTPTIPPEPAATT